MTRKRCPTTGDGLGACHNDNSAILVCVCSLYLNSIFVACMEDIFFTIWHDWMLCGQNIFSILDYDA